MALVGHRNVDAAEGAAASPVGKAAFAPSFGDGATLPGSHEMHDVAAVGGSSKAINGLRQNSCRAI